MALSRTSTKEIPKDAVVLTEEEAMAYQWKIISGWDKTKDVWALKYTPTILGSMAAVTSIFVNNHYRVKLKLGNYGKMSSYLPIVVIPAMFSLVSHKFFIQRPLLLDPLAECPLCLQMRAAVFQTGLGAVYPTILAPLAAFMYATRHYTYRLPSVTEKPLEILQLWRKMSKPILPVMGTLIAGQGLVAMYLTYKQAEQNLRLQMEMHRLEKKLEHGDGQFLEPM